MKNAFERTNNTFEYTNDFSTSDGNFFDLDYPIEEEVNQHWNPSQISLNPDIYFLNIINVFLLLVLSS